MKILDLRNFRVLILFALSFLFQSAWAQSLNWQHPGVLVSKDQLDFIKAQVQAKNQPFYQEFLNAQKSNYGSLTYTPKGPPSGGVIQCGSYSKPDNGCSSANDDTGAAYVQALLWYITENKVYANNVIRILNVYGHNLKGYGGASVPCPGSASTCSNGPLQAGWDASKWPRAAEIIRYGLGGSAGWAPNDIAAFSQMLRTAYVPAINKGSAFNGNWELAMIEGMMGIAVFNEDLALLQQAQKFWTERVPAYFYNYNVDNPFYPNTHAPFPVGRETSAEWNNQLIFSPTTTGVSQETCRDLKHTEDGIASAINAAETDYIQGGTLTANLYSANGAQERLIASLNLMAGLETVGSKTAPVDFCTGAKGSLTLGIGTTYAIGYNHYHNRLHDPRMADASGTSGLNGTANTYHWIQDGLLPQDLSSDSGVHMALFEPLTHYANATSSPNFSFFVSPTSQNVTSGSATSYVVTVNSISGYVGNVVLSVTSGLPVGATASFNPIQVSAGAGTSTLTISTTSLTPVGTYSLQLSGTDGAIVNKINVTLAVDDGSIEAAVMANNKVINVGDVIPSLTYSVSPVVTFTTLPTCSTKGTSTSPAGNYPIICSGAVAAGYTFVYVDGTLTINGGASSVTISARNVHAKSGQPIPALTYRVRPSKAVLTTNPICTTTATPSSPKGSYPIDCSGAQGPDFPYTYEQGTLRMGK